jgi:transcriptional regulator with XRE-family HTH domain
MNKDIFTSPQNLAKKLLQIREFLNLSQTEMLKRLGFDDRLYRSNISQYERGEREPPLLVILSYAKLAGIMVEVLIDDEVELPVRMKKSNS